MNYLHDLIYRLRAGESERRIARDLKVSRPTVHKYKVWAQEQGYLDPEQPLPEPATLEGALGPVPRPPQTKSSLVPHREVIEQLLDQGVEMTANQCYGPEYLVIKWQTGWKKERQKRPVRVSFLLRRIIATSVTAKSPIKVTVNRVDH